VSRIISILCSSMLLLLFVSVAHADNCGDLQDCYAMHRTLLAALVGIAAIAALIFVLPEILVATTTAEAAQAAGIRTALEFGETDLVYGPSAKGALRKLVEEAGGRLLTDLPKPPELTFEQFSLQTLDKAAESGNMIRFDLTNMQDIAGTLNGMGKFADTVTGAELRHIQLGWGTFQNVVKFYFRGAEVPPP
jgi:hypothetical protein